ncbi:hypothetical protein HS125_09900 [bacterium]|nr:hypothetical protein [bacterium]
MNRGEARIDVVKLMAELERNLETGGKELDLRAALRDLLGSSLAASGADDEQVERILGVVRQHLSEERAHFYRVLQLFVQRLERQEEGESRLSVLQAQLEEQRQAMESVRQLVKVLQEDGSSLARHTAQTLEGVVSRVEVYGRNVEENNQRIRGLIEKSAQLEERLAAAARTLETAGDVNARIEDATRQLEGFHGELHGLLEKIATLESRPAGDAKVRLDDLMHHVEETRAELHSLAERTAGLEARPAGDANVRLDDLAHHLEEHHGELHGLLEKIATLESRLEAAAPGAETLAGLFSRLEVYGRNLEENNEAVRALKQRVEAVHGRGAAGPDGDRLAGLTDVREGYERLARLRARSAVGWRRRKTPGARWAARSSKVQTVVPALERRMEELSGQLSALRKRPAARKKPATRKKSSSRR